MEINDLRCCLLTENPIDISSTILIKAMVGLITVFILVIVQTDMKEKEKKKGFFLFDLRLKSVRHEICSGIKNRRNNKWKVDNEKGSGVASGSKGADCSHSAWDSAMNDWPAECPFAKLACKFL